MHFKQWTSNSGPSQHRHSSFGVRFHAAQATLQEFGRQHIDILVSNAAVNPAGGPILQMEDKVRLLVQTLQALIGHHSC